MTKSEKAAKQRAYYQRTREKWRAYAKAQRQKNPVGRAAYLKQYRRQNPEVFLRATVKRYGLTLEEFLSLANLQGGRCAICRRLPQEARGDVRRLAVDHDHQTNAVRGLLCNHCNAGLGAFGDDILRLQAAIDYLKRG